MADSDGTVAIPKSVLWQLGLILSGAMISGVVSAIWLAATSQSDVADNRDRIDRSVQELIKHTREIGVIQGRLESMDK